MIQPRYLAFAFLVAASAPPARAETVAIRDARIHTVSGPVIEKGTVVFRDGRLTAVGADVTPPEGARLIDGSGFTVVPGFIESYTHLGLVEIDLVPATHDEDESSDPVTPHIRAADGFHPASKLLPVARVNGVTAALVVPGEGNVFAGQSALVRLDGWTLEDMLVKSPVALHVNFGEPPKGRYGGRTAQPSTRMGIAATVREAFVKAQQYAQKWTDYERRSKTVKDPAKAPSRPEADLKLEALLRALRGELPVIARAHRLDDILTAVRLSEEFGLRLILARGTEAYKAAPLLAQKKIAVLLGPVTTQPDSMEAEGAIYENAAILHKAGVPIALLSGDPHFARNLPFQAGLAVRYGLPHAAALAAITLEPARILGVDDRMGSLDRGKSADLVVFEGDPLEPRSLVRHVFIAGRELSLTSYQTDLYETYRLR